MNILSGIVEFFTEDIEAVSLTVGEDYTWTLPDLLDGITLKSVEVDLDGSDSFVSFDEDNLVLIVSGKSLTNDLGG